MSEPSLPGPPSPEVPDPTQRQPGVFIRLIELHGRAPPLGGRALRTLGLELDTPVGAGGVEEVAAVLREQLVGLPLAAVRQRPAGDWEPARGSAWRVVARSGCGGWGRPVATALCRSGVM